MAHMKPVAERFAAYHVETEQGTEIVPESLCGTLDQFTPELTPADEACLMSYLQGGTIHNVERKEGWYARLSADGYLDCTSWEGPYATEQEALYEVKEQFEVDDQGESIDYLDDSESYTPGV